MFPKSSEPNVESKFFIVFQTRKETPESYGLQNVPIFAQFSLVKLPRK